MQALVSVIITCRNCQRFLQQAVQNTFNQTYKNIECIIVDDGSTDNTHSIAEQLVNEYDNIKYVVNNGAHSPASARNFGVTQAKGEWIQFYDVDDYLYPDKLKAQMDFLSDNHINNKQAAVVYSDFEVIWENAVGKHANKITNIIGDHTRDELLNKIMSWHDGPTMPFHVNSTLFSKTLFEKKTFNTDMMIFEEIEFFVDLLIQNIPFHYVPVMAMSYRIHDTNLTKDYRRSRLGYIQFLNKVYDKDPSLLKLTSKRINLVMERAVKENDSEIFSGLMAIISRANIPFCFKWKGQSIRHRYLMIPIFWIKKVSRCLRAIFSSKNNKKIVV